MNRIENLYVCDVLDHQSILYHCSFARRVSLSEYVSDVGKFKVEN